MTLPTTLILLTILVCGFVASWRRMKRSRRRPELVPPLLGPTVRIRPRPHHAQPRTQSVQPKPPASLNSWASRRSPADLSGMSEHIPVRSRRHFLSGNEQRFLVSLEAALGREYRVFRNVRLDDLFVTTTHSPRQEKATTARLRERQVDYVVVALPELQPVLAIEFEDTAGDPVTAAACAGAGLLLARVRAEKIWTSEGIRAYLQPGPSARMSL